jgi:predicted SAM-dependent methyltransferase
MINSQLILRKSWLKSVVPVTGLKRYYATRQALLDRVDSARVVLSQAKRWFFPIPHPQTADGSVNLHLGCGDINHPQFINIDGRPAPHVHYVRSLANLSLFKNETVDLIYASHCLEHFPHTQVAEILQEWSRVLKPGGILRLAVPDFDSLVTLYQDYGNDVNLIMNPLMGGQDYRYNFHRIAFNQSSLTKLLIEVGFHNIQPWQPYLTELTQIDDHSSCQFQADGKTYPISLNLQAHK